MATVNGYTAEYMEEIRDTTIIDAHLDGDDLVLVPRGNAVDSGTYPEINVGSVRGPTGSPGITTEEADDLLLNGCPVGTVLHTVAAAAPTRWRLLQGQTLTDAQTLFPTLWALAPTAWRSGSNLVLPDGRGRSLFGMTSADTSFDAIGKTGGSKDATLPAHTHNGPSHTHNGPSHSHSTPSHTHTIPSHNHTINHNHAAAETASTTHRHTIRTGSTANPSGDFAMPASGAEGPGIAANFETSHTHEFNMPGFTGNSGLWSGNTGSANGGNTGSAGTGTTSASGTGATSSTGTSATNANLPPYLALNVMIKVE